MQSRPLPRPTDRELAILRVLWERGPCTVREAQGALGEEMGYTTVLKFMQIMTEKGLVTRDDSQRTHVYAAAAPAESTQRQLVGELLARAFGGSAKKLILHALSSRRTSAAELQEIRKMLDELEKNRGRGSSLTRTKYSEQS